IGEALHRGAASVRVSSCMASLSSLVSGGPIGSCRLVVFFDRTGEPNREGGPHPHGAAAPEPQLQTRRDEGCEAPGTYDAHSAGGMPRPGDQACLTRVIPSGVGP